VVVAVVQPDKEILANVFGVGLLIAAIVLFIGFYQNARDHEERRRVLAMIPLFVGCVAFFAIFEQAGTTLSLFADTGVRRQYLGFDFLPAYYQDVNPIFIILLAPVFAWMWVRLVKAKKEPSSVIKFAIGMVLVALSFIVMLPAIGSINTGERVSPNFLIALYFFSTCAELCISPVGLSSMNKLAPARLAGMVMGTWFLGTSIGEYLAGRAAGFSASHGYAFLFYTLIIASLVVAAGLFGVAPMIRRMMAGGAAPLPSARAVEPSAEAPPAA
ncbi:MAG: peptide MFS transporter, partial [Acidobacteriota bacterium]